MTFLIFVRIPFGTAPIDAQYMGILFNIDFSRTDIPPLDNNQLTQNDRHDSTFSLDTINHETSNYMVLEKIQDTLGQNPYP